MCPSEFIENQIYGNIEKILFALRAVPQDTVNGEENCQRE
jgi:hypothetical protein